MHPLAETLLDEPVIAAVKTDEALTAALASPCSAVFLLASTLIRRARHRGLLTVQRAFILDSLSLTSLSGQLEQGKPDFVEILPGIMPRVIAEISARTQVPVIAGGLLRDKADVMAAMRAGAAAVSTSAPSLWDI